MVSLDTSYEAVADHIVTLRVAQVKNKYVVFLFVGEVVSVAESLVRHSPIRSLTLSLLVTESVKDEVWKDW